MLTLIVYSLKYLPMLYFLYRIMFHKRRIVSVYCLMLFTTFLGPNGSLPVPGLTMAVLMAGIVLGLEVLEQMLTPKKPMRFHLADLWPFGLLVWALLAGFYRGGDFGHMRSPFVIFAVCMLGKFRGRSFSESDLRQLSHAVLIAATVDACICMLQAWQQDHVLGGLLIGGRKTWAQEARPNGLHANPNAAAVYLLMGLSAVLTNIGWKRKVQLDVYNVSLVLCGLMMFYGLILGQGRSGLIGALLIIAIRMGDLYRSPRATSLGLLGGGVVLILLVPSLLGGLLESIFAGRDYTGFGREERWSEAFTILLADPLFGDPGVRAAGLTRVASLNYHNDVLNLAVDLGLPAAFFFVMIQAQVGVSLWFKSTSTKRYDGFQTFVLLALLSCAFHSFFHVVLASGICFWLLIGLAAERYPPTRAAPPRPINYYARLSSGRS